jgi:myo-inositol-1-phosphate synthase
MKVEPVTTPLGVFIIGARGSVAATMIAGARAISRGLADHTGMVSALPALALLELVPVTDLVFGGYEIRSGDLVEQARGLERERVLPAGLTDQLLEDLQAVDRRIRPGHLHVSGEAIDRLAGDGWVQEAAGPAAIAAQLRRDLEAFRAETGCQSLLLVNLASTEPAPSAAAATTLADGSALQQVLAGDDDPVGVPLSTIYAHAALAAGIPYVNFTPSTGASCPALLELAERRGLPHAGQDGKTGETLMKTVLGPMLVARNLRLRSWHGFNLLGNRDGEVLAQPENLQSKVRSKDLQLRAITGRDDVETGVRIDYVPTFGDWKTAWDCIVFDGFLGTTMGLEFTWRGCDSALAAPLVLDLIRLVDHARRAGRAGVQPQLAAFFKNPLGVTCHDLAEQMRLLTDYAEEHSPDTGR